MDTLSAFMMGAANRDKELMVFDWNKAARLIKERNAQEAAAGLSSDWEWTGGTILKNGEPIFENRTYLASTWAEPELMIDGDLIECFVMQSETPGWDAETKWPESALAILEK